MTKDIAIADEVPFLGADWFNPLEAGIRQHIRGFIENLLEEELAATLRRGRYDRSTAAAGHRNGHRDRQLLGTFGPMTVSVPRARVTGSNGRQAEWRSQTLPAYKRLTVQAERLIAGAYLAGTNTRRVRRALAALFGGAVGKDTVSRTWHKVQCDWEAWQKRDLAGDDVVRLILDGTVVRVRLDRKATSLSVLVALGVRRDGQKVLLALRNMGGESEAAWRVLLDDLVARGLAVPELVIVDGASGLEKAIAALWNDVPLQRCTVHKHERRTPRSSYRLPTPSSGCTRSSSDASRPNACCPAPTPLACCSGHYWPAGRSPYAKLTAGKPCISPLPSIFLIWWHKPITSPLEMTAIGNFHQVNDATGVCAIL